MSNTPIAFNQKHATHKETLLKFLALAAILVSYFGYMSWKYDASTGFGLAVLAWSFFVLCTPVADGGFIVAFPIRLLFGVKMAITQGVVWFVAVAVNLYMLYESPETYELTFLTQLLHQILTQIYPYWAILLISAAGTFLSIYFGDEMMDVTSHQQREKHHRHGFNYRLLLVLGLGILTVVAYYELLSTLDISIPQ
ncbi:hypothetical protein EY643_16135 [Halioglobus maricola]|uniref:Uncharacterized protein n=1 Tax=Halioglobus maricola TaxID=2601894 RepID=A0A5P9NNM6_9GAMM|nr:hypothetical protein [Halioglobus maricola]QFU77055.1 hypothetical protein EY643_16135 [Halioglobus maricola]